MLDKYLAEPRNLNRYVYALNNPLKHTDPTGMRPPNQWEQKALNRLDELIAQAHRDGNTDLEKGLQAAKAEISDIIAKLPMKKDNIGVNIAVFAILNIGNKEFADASVYSLYGYSYGAGQNKCNVFVAAAHAYGGHVRKGRYPTNGTNGPVASANWLGDFRDPQKLKNLPVVWTTTILPGDVVAWRNTDANKPGHSSISIGGGVAVYAGGGDGSPQVQTLDYLNRGLNAGGSTLLGLQTAHEPGVIRRFNGKP